MIPIGTEVKIKSIEWYSEQEGPNGGFMGRVFFNRHMATYCGETAKIENWAGFDAYSISINGRPINFIWCEEFFEPIQQTISVTCDGGDVNISTGWD